MAGVGAGMGVPLSLALYRVMDAAAPGTGAALAAGKFVVDQLVGCVLWQAAYLAISEPYRAGMTRVAHGVMEQRRERRQQQRERAPAVAAVCCRDADASCRDVSAGRGIALRLRVFD